MTAINLAAGANTIRVDVSDRTALISPSGSWPYDLPFSGGTNALLHVKTVARATATPITLSAYQTGVATSDPTNRWTFATILLTPTPSNPTTSPSPLHP